MCWAPVGDTAMVVDLVVAVSAVETAAVVGVVATTVGSVVDLAAGPAVVERVATGSRVAGPL